MQRIVSSNKARQQKIGQLGRPSKQTPKQRVKERAKIPQADKRKPLAITTPIPPLNYKGTYLLLHVCVCVCAPVFLPSSLCRRSAGDSTAGRSGPVHSIRYMLQCSSILPSLSPPSLPPSHFPLSTSLPPSHLPPSHFPTSHLPPTQDLRKLKPLQVPLPAGKEKYPHVTVPCIHIIA